MPMKVFELAQEYQIDPKVLLNHLKELGVFVSSHISILNDEEVAKVRATITHIQKRQKAPQKKTKPTVVRKKAAETKLEVAERPQEEEQRPQEVIPEAVSLQKPEAEREPVLELAGEKVEEEKEEKEAQKEEAQIKEHVKVKRQWREQPAIVIKRPGPSVPEPQEKAPKVEEITPKVEEVTKEISPPSPEPEKESGEQVKALKPEPVRVPVEIKEKPEPPKVKEQKQERPAPRESLQEPAKILHRPRPEQVERPGPPISLVKPSQQKVEKPVTLPEPEPWVGKKKMLKAFEVITQERPGRGKIKRKEVIHLRAELEERERERGLPFRPAKKKEEKKTEITVPKAIKRKIKVMESITVGELARRMGVKSSEVIKKLLSLGVIATVNQMLDPDEAALVASDFGYEVEKVLSRAEELLEEAQAPEAEANLKPRPPVVTVMGHVDHGKTSLLDAIRQTHVTEQEFGGITQHIGAYQVEIKGQTITFLDTPGHEAFTSLRARGAQVTDIVVLVVAADDGVMNQTKEAIDHAKAAGVPILVAINKIDKPNADPERVKQELAALGLVPEAWGGDTIFCEVSAKKQINIDVLLENILILAEVLELKANPDRPARGTVIEARLDKRRGPLATVLVQEGTLRVNDAFVAGIYSGKVRMMMDHLGRKVTEAGPSTPVEVVGASGVPTPGEKFWVVADEKEARDIEIFRREKMRREGMAQAGRISLEKLRDQMEAGEVKELAVVLKGDVQGSIESIRDTLLRMGGEKIKINVLHASVGGITENDVNLASASNAIIIGFNVRPEPRAQALAEEVGVDIRLYNIIYDLIEDVEKALRGMLEPTKREVVMGRGEVLQIFKISKVGTVAGTVVRQGKIARNAKARLIRDNVIVYDGRIGSLRRYQDDVKEVTEGQDCGIHLDNYNDVKVGDIIECYEIEEIAPEI